ncbi:hypothetical protein RIB2604_03001370 [Aspergillus luchuensis]|uniref:Uncharacterized protein n=1 Tax=Aspergillus kawachii TaxID=1069201 RepID=A0A146FVT5_ASPKA|nr:hypothetical protein AKAW_08712 [Aspergillus luchuensis IFO 4308]GAT29605.1 hypothetical protein RIB2604_03001370 [Aspergillus luchuensis]
MDYATFSLTLLQLLVMIGVFKPFKTGYDNFFMVKNLVEGKDTTEDLVSDTLDELERDGGVRGLATAEKLKECAQKLVRKMQEIRERYGKCRGSGWLVVALKPRVYSDGSELKELERRFEVLVDNCLGRGGGGGGVVIR